MRCETWQLSTSRPIRWRGLLGGAWRRRHHLSLADALYVELARLDTVVVTTDHRLSRATPSRARLPPERPRRS
jgi:predicted nucleic acid-binding protein